MLIADGNRNPVRRRRLHEEVTERLEEAITSGEYQPGEQLPSERDLMTYFGVGRPSIREALFTLRRMGLISIKAGERARVATPTPAALVNELSGAARHLLATPSGMRSFQQARMLFESALAEHAARNATDEDIETLRAALDRNAQSVGYTSNFVDTDVEFHLAIAQIARNPIILALHAGLVEWLAKQRAISSQYKGAENLAAAAHTKIYGAIARHDAIGAGNAMREHLFQVESFYWAASGESLD